MMKKGSEMNSNETKMKLDTSAATAPATEGCPNTMGASIVSGRARRGREYKNLSRYSEEESSHQLRR